MPATEITHIISKVSFPLYSKLQDDFEKLNQGYLKIIKLTSFMIFPLAGLIFLLIRDFTVIFLGEKWLPMVVSAKLLVIWGTIRALGVTAGILFYGLGRPKIVAQLEFVQLVLLILFIYPLSKAWGINGTSLAVVLASVGPNLAALLKALKCIKAKVRPFMLALLYPFMSALVSLIAVLLLRSYFFGNLGIIPEFAASVVAYIGVFFAAIFIMDKCFNADMLESWKPIIKIWPIPAK